MKHTFVFIDGLIVLIKNVPRSIETPEKKAEAKAILENVLVHAGVLKKLVEAHKTEKYLQRLHDTHIDKISDWADQVTALFKQFDQLLTTVEQDAVIMEDVIENKPEKWLSTVSDMALGMVMTGLHNEEEAMKRFRAIALFEIHELEEHLQEHGIKKILKMEEYILSLLE